MSSYKIHLMQENAFLNNESYEDRCNLLKVFMRNVPKNLIKENADGTRIDLDLIDEKALKIIFMYVCGKTGNEKLVEGLEF